jgi:hypothetical protein
MAVGLLLTSRESRFAKEISTYRFRTRMQVKYLCHDMDGITMMVLVRPLGYSGDEWTQVRCLHDIRDEDKRKSLEDAIDQAIANPLGLGLKKYRHEKEPELHMFEG